MDIVWDGTTRAETLDEGANQIRKRLAEAAKSYDWPRVFELLSEHTQLVNTSRPGGSSLYSPLHQAAHGGAPVEVAQRLIGKLAFRTLQNARGERPVDVAER
jgi:hypothetical protein